MVFLAVDWSLAVSITSGVFSLFLAMGIYFVTTKVETGNKDMLITILQTKEELKNAFQSGIKETREEITKEMKELENKVVLKDSEDWHKKYIDERMKSFERHVK